MTAERRAIHIAATGERTLCDTPTASGRVTAYPWPEYLEAYSVEPSVCCPRCARFARRSADRFLALRAADDLRTRHQDQ